MPFALTHNAYGKSAVRLTKVVRDGDRHELFEIDASIELEGDFAAAYAVGDNRNVIATDTIKNTVYVLAKENDFSSVEQFATILARHFLATYPQVSAVKVELSQTVWVRIAVDGVPHDHAFTSGGPRRRVASARLDRAHEHPDLTGGVRDLPVLKTTASEWRDFHADRYRTLKDSTDRILATRIDADWTYVDHNADFAACDRAIDAAILRTFATQHSLGVQQTLQQMGEAALAACPFISSISFTLPNMHRVPFNLEPFGLTFDNDVFVATDEPYGLIRGTVARGDDVKHALSTHVLDQTQGRPALGVRVTLYKDGALVTTVVTNVDGRTDAPLLAGESFAPGAYRIEFAIGDYYESRGHPDARRFLDVVPIAFVVDEPERGYHVPLLVTPWGYSTYRGS